MSHSRRRRKPDPGRTWLYWLYNNCDELLYVGITNRLFARMAQHQASQPWWREVARIEFFEYDNREEAAGEELRLIKSCCPPYNTQGTAGNWWELVERYPFIEEWETSVQLDPSWPNYYRCFYNAARTFSDSDCDVIQYRIGDAHDKARDEWEAAQRLALRP